jgi:2-amino-4-hydroxy-6-hydroxymethyldihydropteridine diphosphokinase
MFYNSVIEIAFEGAATDLLAITQSIEKKIGRAAAPERNAPRVIDIDLLYFGDEVIATDDLELPHPRIAQRRFVLQPLAEICPDRILPGQTQSIAKLLHDLKTDEPPLVFVK